MRGHTKMDYQSNYLVAAGTREVGGVGRRYQIDRPHEGNSTPCHLDPFPCEPLPLPSPTHAEKKRCMNQGRDIMEGIYLARCTLNSANMWFASHNRVDPRL